jgi:hypothetical protein
MPRNVELSVTTIPAVLPPGVAAGLMRFSILDTLIPPNVIATQDVAGTTALFLSVVNGIYVAVVQALDTLGADLGVPATGPCVVTDLLFASPVSPVSVVVT